MQKKVAPILIVIIMSLYILGYVFMLVTGMLSGAPIAFTIILGILAVMMCLAVVALIYTLVVRLKEIDKEEDNDLSKY